MPQVKGSTIRTRRDFVLRYHGPEAWSRVRGALRDADRDLLDGALLASAWYPFDLCTRLERAIVDACAEGDERICVDMGAFSAAENLATLYRTFLAGGESPADFYKRLEQLYPTLHDFGSMNVFKPENRDEIHIVHDYQGFATRTNCLAALGFFRGAAVSVAIPAVRVEETWCQALGNASCLLVVTWGDGTRRR
jgi:hypothetical protein